MIAMMFLVLMQVNDDLVAEVVSMDAFSWVFMLVSMGTVTTLTAWCFLRIMRTRRHFDPDGTGPASPPVPGRVEEP
jgi:hypothetical protein